MISKYAFDPACLELAEHVLPDLADRSLSQYEHDLNDLAQAIQDAIEIWLDRHEGESARPTT